MTQRFCCCYLAYLVLKIFWLKKNWEGSFLLFQYGWYISFCLRIPWSIGHYCIYLLFYHSDDRIDSAYCDHHTCVSLVSVCCYIMLVLWDLIILIKIRESITKEIQFFNQCPREHRYQIILLLEIINSPHIYLILQYKGYVLYSLVEQSYDW